MDTARVVEPGPLDVHDLRLLAIDLDMLRRDVAVADNPRSGDEIDRGLVRDEDEVAASPALLHADLHVVLVDDRHVDLLMLVGIVNIPTAVSAPAWH